MATEETVIATKLGALQKELAEKERKQQEAEENRRRKPTVSVAERGRGRPPSTEPGKPEVELKPLTADQERLLQAQLTIKQLKGENTRKSQTETLKIQVALLEELKTQVEAQRTENQYQFRAMKDTTERSSRQGFWLTVVSSAVSLVLGWLLSLLTTPAGILHAFGR